MSPAVFERDADLAGAEIVERRLRDRAREHMAAAARPAERCNCGGLPERDEDRSGRWRCLTCCKRTGAPFPKLPRGLRIAIARAVADAGGTDDDARDLTDVWARALRDCDRRAAAIRTGVQLAECGCADGGDASEGGRCRRCHGRLTGNAA